MKKRKHLQRNVRRLLVLSEVMMQLRKLLGLTNLVVLNEVVRPQVQGAIGHLAPRGNIMEIPRNLLEVPVELHRAVKAVDLEKILIEILIVGLPGVENREAHAVVVRLRAIGKSQLHP